MPAGQLHRRGLRGSIYTIMTANFKHPAPRRGIPAAALLLIIAAVVVSPPAPLGAHRSGCHRWHSCPSDHNTYICGDTGHCSSCPDNQYCRDGKPIAAPATAPSEPAAPATAPAAAPTAPTPPSAPAPDDPAALFPAYQRSDYHRTWADPDGDCQNNRHEVLIAESITAPVLSPDTCTVISGLWHDPYSGTAFTDPRQLDIDHLVPLREAHISGAHLWEPEKKARYAQDITDPQSLIAVSSAENRAKGSRDPAEWLPSNSAYHCEYIRTWVAVKQTWGLAMDAAERDFITQKLLGCEN